MIAPTVDVETGAPERVRRRPTRGGRTLFREAVVPVSLEKAFKFFSDAFHLDLLTPPWLGFAIVTPLPIEMKPGTVIDYRIRLHGFPIRWRTLISEWEPPHRFVDEQIRGPYRWWRHTHRFEACAQGTRVIDEVEYAAPLAWLSERLLVRRDLERIFDYRGEALQRHLTGAACVNDSETAD